jgi:hypothetical protein
MGPVQRRESAKRSEAISEIYVQAMLSGSEVGLRRGVAEVQG